MTKITRPGKNIVAFGSNAEGTERTTFGTTTQANDLDSNLNDSFARGWGIVAGSDLPTKQDFNAMGYTLGQLNAYLYQMGIAEYDAAQEYHQNSFTNYNGVIYKSLTNNNVANTPNTSTANWESVIDGKYLPLTGGTLTGKLNGTDINATGAITINGASVLKAGDYGLGGTRAVITNYDTVYANGFYYSSTSALGDKPFNYSYVISNVTSLGSSGKQGAIIAFGVGDSLGQVKFKSYQQQNDSGWVDLITTANVSNYQGLGYGQTWQDVTSSRSTGVTYTNTTGKPIFISATVNLENSSGVAYLKVDNIEIARISSSNQYVQVKPMAAIIPNGSSYTIETSVSVLSWAELR